MLQPRRRVRAGGVGRIAARAARVEKGNRYARAHPPGRRRGQGHRAAPVASEQGARDRGGRERPAVRVGEEVRRELVRFRPDVRRARGERQARRRRRRRVRRHREEYHRRVQAFARGARGCGVGQGGRGGGGGDGGGDKGEEPVGFRRQESRVRAVGGGARGDDGAREAHVEGSDHDGRFQTA